MEFPTEFLWGASTASHQVEGATHNQWSNWEKANSERLTATAKDRLGWLPTWPDIADQASSPQNYISGAGVDHYNRYREDFDILKNLNMNAFRFSIEWSRIQPEEDHWDEDAIAHYQTYIAELRKRSISPVVTLWHWTMPTWFADKGGFAKRANLKYFERYVQKVCELLDDSVRYVITLNEPNVYAIHSYGIGEWPPQHKNPIEAFRVYFNLVAAHNRAYHIIKRAHPHIQVGVAAHLTDTRPVHPRSALNKLSVSVAMYGWNWWYLNRIRRQQDFIGINYYFTDYRDWRWRLKNPKQPLSDMGWYMEPVGIQQVIEAAYKRYRKPIIITENGLADAHDKQRAWWLDQTIPALADSLKNGVDLRGYLHWSLLDNFEWAFGWWAEFGLIHVDRTTQTRTIRTSAEHYAQLIARSHGTEFDSLKDPHI